MRRPRIPSCYSEEFQSSTYTVSCITSDHIVHKTMMLMSSGLFPKCSLTLDLCATSSPELLLCVVSVEHGIYQPQIYASVLCNRNILLFTEYTV